MMKDGESAFPQHGWTKDHDTLERMANQGGMSLRDWFAGMALGNCSYKMVNPEHQASLAYQLADAMVAERDKEV